MSNGTRPQRALIVIDVQNEYFTGNLPIEYPDPRQSIINIGIAMDAAYAAGIPIIAGEEGICSGCGVATLSISYYDIGYKAGEMAYDILVNGADITTMKIESAPNVTKMYNPTICEELGITIPDGYEAIEE